MDRFIDDNNGHLVYEFIVFKIQYGQIYSDKTKQPTITPENLKSNMDRFIVINLSDVTEKSSKFKNLYGQIYSLL